MTLTSNWPQTQLDNIEEVEVLKGPIAVLYGGVGASQGEMVSVIRKKPQATPTAELFYRVDADCAQIGGWRDADSNRLNASPDSCEICGEP